MDWNLTRPFRQSRVEAVWSNLGDVGQAGAFRMSTADDAQDEYNVTDTGECPFYNDLLLDLSREEDKSSAKEDDATNDNNDN